jgi:hypothetical protein
MHICAELAEEDIHLQMRVMVLYMAVKKLLSIVIPTHNRSCYAVACVQSLLEIDSRQFQVVVHDTSDDDCGLAAWSATQDDSRLCYVHWNGRLSMTENHERAVALAEGEYVCVIGDDDSVSSRIIEVAEYAKANEIELLTPVIKAIYSWPDFKTSFLGSAHAGKLYLGKVTGKIAKKSCQTSIQDALNNACQGTEGLPKFYHGLVKRSCLEKLHSDTGAIFYGASPDISASLGLALTNEYYYVIDFPFTIPGASSGSNTGRSAVNKHKGDIESDPHMIPFRNLSWPKELPYFFSVETVWGHAAWETLKQRSPDSLSGFNLNRFYAVCKVRHSDYKVAIGKAASGLVASNDKRYSSSASVLAQVKFVIELTITKLKRILHPTASNGMDVYGPFENVRYARQALDAKLDIEASAKGWCFNEKGSNE